MNSAESSLYEPIADGSSRKETGDVHTETETVFKLEDLFAAEKDDEAERDVIDVAGEDNDEDGVEEAGMKFSLVREFVVDDVPEERRAEFAASMIVAGTNATLFEALLDFFASHTDSTDTYHDAVAIMYLHALDFVNQVSKAGSVQAFADAIFEEEMDDDTDDDSCEDLSCAVCHPQD